MKEFRAYASNFEIFPNDTDAFRHLSPLLSQLNRVDFILSVENPSVNQGQMASNFDGELERELYSRGAQPYHLRLPEVIPQEFDFAFEYNGRAVAVEIEKSNREKILRDILKCHMYLHAGVYYALVGLPRNYAHSRGMWDLYNFGVQRFKECMNYGFGTSDKLGRILLLGFTQYDKASNEQFSSRIRQQIRERAAGGS
jgi:hypothetical protein